MELDALDQIRGSLWAGEEAIRVLAEDQLIRFKISNVDGSVQIFQPQASAESSITLRLFFTGCHYEPIIPESASDRRAWSNAKFCKKEKTDEQKNAQKLKLHRLTLI